MNAHSTFSRRRLLGGVAAIGAAGAGMAVLGAAPAQAAPSRIAYGGNTNYGGALDLLVRARRELAEGGREPSRIQALRRVDQAIAETRQAMREDRRWDNDWRWKDRNYDRWDERRFR